jgi:hypothetical protein
MAQFFVVTALKSNRFRKFSHIAQGSPMPSDDAKLAVALGGGLLKSTCPVRTHHVSFVLNNLRRYDLHQIISFAG